MAQVKMNINNRNYEIACDDGEENHVQQLGRYVDEKVTELATRIGQVGDTRLLVMAALLMIPMRKKPKTTATAMRRKTSSWRPSE
jgi:cell division protein ZapA